MAYEYFVATLIMTLPSFTWPSFQNASSPPCAFLFQHLLFISSELLWPFPIMLLVCFTYFSCFSHENHKGLRCPYLTQCYTPCLAQSHKEQVLRRCLRSKGNKLREISQELGGEKTKASSFEKQQSPVVRTKSPKCSSRWECRPE